MADKKKPVNESQLENEIDWSAYTAAQTREIREGLDDGLDVSIYADPQYNAEQMNEIKLGLRTGIDVTQYTDPTYNADKMYFIREGLEDRKSVV